MSPKRKYVVYHVIAGCGCYSNKETVIDCLGATFAVSEAQAKNNIRHRTGFRDYTVGDYLEEGTLWHYLKAEPVS